MDVSTSSLAASLLISDVDDPASRLSRARTSEETTSWASRLNVFIKNTWSSANGTCVLKIDCLIYPRVVQPAFLTCAAVKRVHVLVCSVGVSEGKACSLMTEWNYRDRLSGGFSV